MFVSILMGSTSDQECMQGSKTVLNDLGITSELRILSAHRTPKLLHDYVIDAEKRGCQVFIAGAGMAAHLAGAIAAITLRPVIGVPIEHTLNGLDSLLSTVQMPAGVPVATVATGAPGAKNAGYLAAQILSLQDNALAKRLLAEREKRGAAVVKADAALRKQSSP